VKHVLRLLAPDEGTVMVGDCDIWSASPARLLRVRQSLSAMHSGPTIYDGSVFASISIRENLLATLYEKIVNAVPATGKADRTTSNPYLKLWTPGIPQPRTRPELEARSQEWLERFDLVEVADLLPGEVSAGMRRRMALAGALAVDAGLYILDDPDGALDALNRASIISALLSTHERTGATMLVITHDLDLAERVSDSIAVLAGGRIVFHGERRLARAGLDDWYRLGDEPIEPEGVGQSMPSGPAESPARNWRTNGSSLWKASSASP
jgi:ABC-type transporter Mla maintaining outer membrane lipid asymmetry ATPase subunit MlaF